MNPIIKIKDYLKVEWAKRLPRGVNFALFIYILLLIFICEFTVMQLLPYLLPQHHERVIESLADSVLLSILVSFGLFPLLVTFNHRSRRSEQALANINEGYWLIDKSGQLVDVNEGYCRLVGYSRDDILSMPFEQLIAEPLGLFITRVLASIDNLDSTLIETQQRHKSGTKIDIEASVSFERETGFFVVFLRNISQRKKNEQALTEITHKLEHFVSHSSTVIFAMCKKTDHENEMETCWVSGNLPRILGYTTTEAMKPDWWYSHLYPDDKKNASLLFPQVFFSGTPQTHEYRFLHRDGSVRWIQDNMQVLVGNDTQRNYFIISWNDITEQKLSDIALRISEATAHKSLLLLQQQQFAIDQHAIVSITDLAGCITYVNDRFCSSSGYDREELLGKNHRILNSHKHSKSFFKDMFSTLNKGQVWQAEVCNRTKDDRFFYLETTVVPMRNDQGEIYQYIAIRTDISHRKLLENELKLSAIAFEVQEGVMVTDSDNRMIKVNKAFSQLTGYSAEEVMGQLPSILKSDRQEPPFYEAMWHSITEQHYWQGEIWNQRKNGEVFPEWLTVTAISDDTGQINNFVGVFSDITKDKAYAETIYNLAFFDPLTELPNRRLFLDRLQHSIATMSRSGKQGALLFIDADHFKSLNDTKGHQTGDQLLKQIAERLLSCVRVNDTVARLGGDEFVIMLEDLSEQVDLAIIQAEQIGEKVLWATSQVYCLNNLDYSSTVSIGISLYNKSSNDEELLKCADSAMYQSKASGRNALRFFNPEMQLQLESRMLLENDLRLALAKKQFKLYYQIQVIDGQGAIGAEVLLRWIHPERGFVSPDLFIPMAEEMGVINEIGDWVLLNSCLQLKQWEAQPTMNKLVLAVNVSSYQFRQENFVYKIADNLRAYNINPSKLKLELTESAIIDDIDSIIAKMNALKAIGISFSLDDFGTGHSSLAILKKLPLDQLKIDKSFVIDIPHDQNDAVIAQTIIAMSHVLGFEVIAEGVETEEQRAFLSENGCTMQQGYLYSKPVTVEEFEKLILGYGDK